MDNRFESHAKAIASDFERTRIMFDLSREAGSVFDELVRQTPQVRAAFDSVRNSIPLPATSVASIEGNFYRLPNHNRSFCYALSESESFLDAPVLVFKGTEPLLRDFESMLGWMEQAPLRKSSRVMTDHFPLAEGKIPGALSLKEAMREAEIALDVQRKHLQHYGELARIPVPLLVHSLSDEKRDACAAALRRALSHAAFDRIEPLLQRGLAIYIYYYPAPPIRSNYWGDMIVPAVKRHIDKTLNEERAISGWVRLIVRLLYLGYLPYTVRNEGLGACMDFGNATLDGGFCDPDSIELIDSSTEDEYFSESVIQSLMFLQKTVVLLLGLSGSSTLYPNIEEFACRRYVERLLDESIASEARPELCLDHRFPKLMSPRSIGDVRLCTRRRSRIPSYTAFAKRSGQFR